MSSAEASKGLQVDDPAGAAEMANKELLIPFLRPIYSFKPFVSNLWVYPRLTLLAGMKLPATC